MAGSRFDHRPDTGAARDRNSPIHLFRRLWLSWQGNLAALRLPGRTVISALENTVLVRRRRPVIESTEPGPTLIDIHRVLSTVMSLHAIGNRIVSERNNRHPKRPLGGFPTTQTRGAGVAPAYEVWLCVIS